MSGRLGAALAAVLLVLGCGSSKSCATDCDCTESTTDQKCAGEWICSSGACAYACKSVCNAGPYTCAATDTCNGTICSQKTHCP